MDRLYVVGSSKINIGMPFNIQKKLLACTTDIETILIPNK
jgi:hypothetical protein